MHYDDPDHPDRVTSISVHREPEWDPQSAAELEAIAYLDDMTCRGCGGYLPQTMRTDVGRDVEERDAVVCEDCKAIKQISDAAHAKHGPVKPGEKDPCDDRHFYVAKYLPIPPEWLPEPTPI